MGKKIKCIGRYVMDGVTLGKGNFAHVELATHSVTEVKVAIKIIDTRKIKDEYVRTNLHREARIMTSLRHPNIIRLYETLKAQTLYCLVTEYAPGGELLEYIKCHPDRKLGESTSRPFVRQLVSALDYLHGRNIVHRDLKMENIMLDEKKKNIKLIDFGLSNIFKPDDPLKTHCGSPEYAAPELFIVGRTYGPEIDLWSLGIIMYAMILGRLPFSTQFRDEYHRQRMLQQIQKGLSPVHDREMQVLSADCRNLFHQLIEPNPELRIPLQEIFIHQWLTKNGRSPFYTYTPPPRNKVLRNEIVGALSIMMDMKKGVVNETVKEHRADELSAMYNMMMDQKLKKIGYCDIDHTKKAWQCRTARSRSADKSTTPESSKGKTLLSKRTAGKKSGVGSKAKPKNKSQAGNSGNSGHPVPQSSTVTFANQGQSALDRPKPDDPLSTISSRPSTPVGQSTLHSPVTRDKRSTHPNPIHPAVPNNPSFPHPPTQVDGLTVATGSNGSNQPTHQHQRLFMSGSTDYSRIPLSQRRVPPPKLSLTLDLSITNPGTSSRLKKDQLSTAQKDLQFQQHAGGCQHGIAASSGVPPRLSPKEDAAGKHAHHPTSNPTSRNPGTPATISTSATTSTTIISTTAKQILSGTVSKARRPSSLQYCLKTASGRIARPSLVPGMSGTSNRRSSMPVDQGGGQRSNSITSHGGRKEINVVAPKATPEDSLIDSCSEDTSSSNSDLSEVGSASDIVRPPSTRLPRREERFLGTLAEIVEVVGDSSQMLDELDEDEMDEEMERPSEGVKVRFEERLEPKTGLSHFSNNFELCRDEALKLAEGVKTSQPSSDVTLTPMSNYLSFNPNQDQSLLFTVSSPNLPPRESSETSRISVEKQSVAVVATISAPVVEQSKGDEMSSPLYHYPNWLFNQTGIRTIPRSERPPPLIPNSPAESIISTNVSSSSLRPRLPIKLDFSAGSGLSPGSPSYDDKHARFSHIGIHALDVFFSPEEDLTPSSDKESASETLWRPLVTTLTTKSDQINQTASCKSPASIGSTSLLKKSNYTTPPYIDAKTPTPVEEKLPQTKSQARRPLTLSQQPEELSNLCMPMPRAPLVTSLDIFCDGSTDDDDDDEEEDDGDDPDNLRDENGNDTKNCLDRMVNSSAFCDEKSDNVLSQMTCSSVQEIKATPVSIRQTFNSDTILGTTLERLGDQGEVDSFIPSPVTLIQHSLTCAEMPSVLTSITHQGIDTSAYKDLSPNAATTTNLVTSWLKLPQTSQHKDGHSPGCGTVWPADLNICTRNTVATLQRKHSSSSGLSLDSLEDAKTNGSSEVVATCSLAAKLRGGSFRLPKMASTNDDSATSIQSKDSRLQMPSFKNPIPVFSSLLRRERRTANDTKTSTAIVNKSPSKKNLDTKSTADTYKPSWRQGLAQWLHISRSSSSSSSSQPKTLNSNNNNNNNNNNNSCRSVPKHHHRTYRPAQVNSNNSAPMCITLISNHGRKSSLTITNNIITKTSDFNQDRVLYDCNRRDSQEVAVQTKKLSTLTEGVTTASDRTPSIQNSSPMSKLRQRKTVDWKECQKCTETGHSSDESHEVRATDNMSSLTSSVEASIPFLNNVASQNWSTT